SMYRCLILGVAVLAMMNGLRLAADDPKPAAKPNEAERLFRQMEKKLSESKSIECVFESKPPPGESIALRVRLFLADGNKMRLEEEGTEYIEGVKEKHRLVTISDGTKLVVTKSWRDVGETGGGRQEFPDVSKSLNQEIVKVLALGGGRGLWK